MKRARNKEETGQKREKNMSEYKYMKAPADDRDYDVGDVVEVFCDHDKNSQRIRGWLKGIVVQVDIKMVAVQFRTNVYLTDGWMVPDHILWYPQTSAHIRLPLKGQRKTAIKLQS
jgi:hypothetical protein